MKSQLCPRCQGTIGPVSDLCLDCGFDSDEPSRLWVIVAGLVAFVVLVHLLGA